VSAATRAQRGGRMRATRFLATATLLLIGLAPVSAQTADIGGGVAPITPPVDIPVVGAVLPETTATQLLTAPVAGLPAGSVTSPWCGSTGACGGPFGANGPVTYELYANTGPSLVIGGSELSGRLNTGWRVTFGARTLLFNTDRTAAWAIDTGISYTYNRGRQERGGPLDVHTPAPNSQITPDGLNPFLVRGIHRTTFNYAVGRDWWYRGAGAVGMESGPNSRVGWDIGGRYGTGHADLVPDVDRTNYLRRSSRVTGVFGGIHGNWERPMGNWILFTGARMELEYTFTNLVPPKGADIVGINFLFSAGVRY
jgi:hypothetical protein